jgi:hypothetical protein
MSRPLCRHCRRLRCFAKSKASLAQIWQGGRRLTQRQAHVRVTLYATVLSLLQISNILVSSSVANVSDGDDSDDGGGGGGGGGGVRFTSIHCNLICTHVSDYGY